MVSTSSTPMASMYTSEQGHVPFTPAPAYTVPQGQLISAPAGHHPQMVVMQAPRLSMHRGVNHDFASGVAEKLGYTQIVMGITAMICNSITLALDLNQDGHDVVLTSYTGAGFWIGFWYILTGLFGVTAAKKKLSSAILTFMLLSLISLGIFNFFFLWFAAFGTAIADNGYDCHNYYPEISPTEIPDYIYSYECKKDIPMLVANAVLLGLGILEIFVASLSAVICCQAVCCGTKDYHQQHISAMFQHMPMYVPYLPYQVQPQSIPGGQSGANPAMMQQQPQPTGHN